jgi:hypothetical protein
MIAASDQSKERKAADAKARAPESTAARGADTFAAATAVTISGSANLTTSAQTFAATAVITSGSTGNVTLGTAIAAGQQYVGGAGVDTVSFAVTSTTASTLGAGDALRVVQIGEPDEFGSIEYQLSL